MRVLSAEDLHGLVSPLALIAALEKGLRDFAESKVSVPDRHHLYYPGGTLLTMPAAGPDALGVKIISVTPRNSSRGLPVVDGAFLLSDAVSGRPCALLNAAALTAQRTGALGAVALRCITPADTETIGLIGVGVQGLWQAVYACKVRALRSVYYFSRTHKSAEDFERRFLKEVEHVRLVRCHDAKELLARTSVIVAATTASTPVLPSDAECLAGKHFLSVGSFRPSMQELPDEVYRLAGHIVVDSDAARSEAGDVSGALARSLVDPRQIVHLAQLVTGRWAVDVRQTTVCKSVGSALYDLYAAQAFYAEAQRQKRGSDVAW